MQAPHSLVSPVRCGKGHASAHACMHACSWHLICCVCRCGNNRSPLCIIKCMRIATVTTVAFLAIVDLFCNGYHRCIFGDRKLIATIAMILSVCIQLIHTYKWICHALGVTLNCVCPYPKIMNSSTHKWRFAIFDYLHLSSISSFAIFEYLRIYFLGPFWAIEDNRR